MINTINYVLLIDDDKVTNYYNKHVVKKHTDIKDITCINSGLKAIEYLKKAEQGLTEKPNLIFLDLNMPAMNGWEFAEKYKSLNTSFTKDIKLVLLTTSDSPEDYQRYLKTENIDDFVNKPLSKKSLANVIESHYNLKLTT